MLMGGCLGVRGKKNGANRRGSMKKQDIVLPEPHAGNKRPVNNNNEILFTQTHSNRTDSAFSSHLSPLPSQTNSLKLLITPVMSEEHLLWGEDGSPSVSEHRPNKNKVRSFHLQSNWDHEWGMLINFTQHWSEWRIRKVEPHQQGDRLGIKQNWYLCGADNLDLKAATADQVKEILMRGNACEIRLSQEQPARWKKGVLSQTDSGYLPDEDHGNSSGV